ncbi:MAG: hypothetical protein GF411_04695 [Candidatus Lokiarchaeota archaeon]|nr:hypothetical protein [Candidatus Lokiarchaeota archaeon]
MYNSGCAEVNALFIPKIVLVGILNIPAGETLNSRNIRNYRKYIMVLSFLALFALGSVEPMQSTNQTIVKQGIVGRDIASDDAIKILLVMDNDYGANYHYIRPIIERFGWNVTTTALSHEITPCPYQTEDRTLEMDILLTDIEDITEFDAISIMPGQTHTQLLASTDALNLVKEAAEEGLIVSSWCKAIRVLAKADIIDGRNVTGHDDYQTEVEAAGATFLSQVPPIIDGNIVTGVRSRFYRMEMCIAIATALGAYETDSPYISNIAIEPTMPEPEQNFTITIAASDDTGIHQLSIEIYRLNETNARASDTPTVTGELEDVDGNGLYSFTVQGLEEGQYTIDIIGEDVFFNTNITTNALSLYIEYHLPLTIISQIGVVAASGTVLVIVVFVIIKRR